MVRVDPEKKKMFLGRLQHNDVVILGVLRDFNALFGIAPSSKRMLARLSWIFVSSSFFTACR